MQTEDGNSYATWINTNSNTKLHLGSKSLKLAILTTSRRQKIVYHLLNSYVQTGGSESKNGKLHGTILHDELQLELRKRE